MFVGVRSQVIHVEVSLELLHCTLLMGVVAATAKSAILFPDELAAVLSFILVTQDGPSMCHI